MKFHTEPQIYTRDAFVLSIVPIAIILSDFFLNIFIVKMNSNSSYVMKLGTFLSVLKRNEPKNPEVP